jgi:hypothetical protein
VSASFIRADGSSPRSASILYRADRPGSATSSVFAGAFGGGALATEGLPRTAYPDLLDAFQRVDAAELRALRERAEAAGRGWSVNASASGRDGARVDLTFTDGTLFASFRFDRASGRIERVR